MLQIALFRKNNGCLVVEKSWENWNLENASIQVIYFNDNMAVIFNVICINSKQEVAIMDLNWPLKHPTASPTRTSDIDTISIIKVKVLEYSLFLSIKYIS